MKRVFTLMELMVVMVILAILVSILLPSLTNARAKTLEALCMSNQAQIMRFFYTSLGQSNGKVNIGGNYFLRYSFPLWDKNKFAATGDGYTSLGKVYQAVEPQEMDVWDCPSRKDNSYWQRANINDWPPGSNPNFTHASYSIRATSEWRWRWDEPKLPFISQIDNNLSYISGNFIGLNVYNDHHGLNKMNIFTKINGAVIKSKNADFHSLAVGNQEYFNTNDSIVERMWNILDEQ
jgi:prepilin-type N-terminal cleavage/methylation domain-containing protein